MRDLGEGGRGGARKKKKSIPCKVKIAGLGLEGGSDKGGAFYDEGEEGGLEECLTISEKNKRGIMVNDMLGRKKEEGAEKDVRF